VLLLRYSSVPQGPTGVDAERNPVRDAARQPCPASHECGGPSFFQLYSVSPKDFSFPKEPATGAFVFGPYLRYWAGCVRGVAFGI
jgi:hypothetical protein